jgi:hypothetical protein
VTEPANDPNLNPELAAKNLRLGWILFGLAVLIFAGAMGVAFVYLAVS